MNSIVKNVLLLAAGAAVGFFTASVMAKKEYQGVINDLEKELNADLIKKREAKSRDKELSEKKADEAVKTYNKLAVEDGGYNNPESSSDVVLLDKNSLHPSIHSENKKVTRMYGGDKKEPIETYVNRAKAENEHPQEEDHSNPYIISLEEFSEEHPEYDKSTIYYYVSDDTLTDENEEIMDDIPGTVGDEALDLFTVDDDGHASGDVVYVRNERLAIDYEIVGLYKSYKETMGIE